MNDRQVNIGLNFNVNKQQLDALQKSLNDVILKAQEAKQTLPDYSEPFEEAAAAAKDLQNLLNTSWNSKIGQLDLAKVEKGIINLYGSTKDFKNILNQIGPEGQKVFNNLTNAVLSTQMPIKQTSAMLDKMAITFKNTIRYGISSAVWNSFSRSVQNAYKYVKDLDKSLNDIRIVSNKSADDMSRFAVQANKAAQALGASTLDYTKGALIYYQQGLTDEEVIKRTDVTVKMSNVLGRSAQEISDYMTAIWNNFYDGSKSLEYYADVLTKLGAETASSAEEISQGLEKFAAIGKTVGLSYEYAAAALTTVTDRTRQSAEVVGTAFKTLFARLQGLNLGETLDDGTTLNKYSEALSKVGISIKDEHGELKEMDKILDEMGAKWQTLNKDQQVALAQTVAGVRQYTQLISLMDNWDFFEQNVEWANGSTGTLGEQQAIYLDSIEARLNQLNTAWEGLYDNLFDEEAIKFFTAALTKIINLANTFVTGLGGGLNSILYLAMTVGNVFSKQISENLVRMEKNAEKAKAALEDTAVAKRLLEEVNTSGSLQNINREGVDRYNKEYEINSKILNIKASMSEKDQEVLDINDQIIRDLKEENEVLLKISQHKKPDTGRYEEILPEGKAKTKEEKEKELLAYYKQKGISEREWTKQDFQSRVKTNEGKLANNQAILTKMGAGKGLTVDDRKSLQAISSALESKIKQNSFQISKAQKQGLNPELVKGFKEQNAELAKQKIAIDEAAKSRKAYKEVFDQSQIQNGIMAQNAALEHNIEIDKKAVKQLEDKKKFQQKTAEQYVDINNAKIDGINKDKEGLILDQERTEQIQKMISGIFTIGTTISAISGAIKTGMNPDLTPWEKFSSIMSVLGTQALIVFNNFDKIKGVFTTLGTTLLPKLAVSLGIVTEAEVAAGISASAMWLKMLGPISIAIGLIAALGAAIYVVYKQNHALEEKLKKTKEAYEEMQKEVEATDKKISELTSDLDAYKDLKGELDSIIEGTEGWQKALEKVNKQILELLNKYPDLANLPDLYTADGFLNTEAIDEYIKKLDKLKSIQSITVTTLQNSIKQTQRDIDEKNLKDKASSLYSTAYFSEQKQQEAEKIRQQAQMRQNTGVSSSRKEASDYYTEHNKQQQEKGKITDYDIEHTLQEQSKTFENYGAKVIDNYKEFANLKPGDFKKKLEEYGIESEKIRDLMQKQLQPAINELQENTTECANAMLNAARTVAKIQIGEDSSQTEQEMYAIAFDKEKKKIAKDVKDKMTDEGKYSGNHNVNQGDGSENTIYQEYLSRLQKAGYSYSAASNGVRGNDQNRTFVYLDENGEEKSLSPERMSEILSNFEATEKINNDRDKYTKASKSALDKVSSGLGGDRDLADILLSKKDVKNVSTSDIDKLISAYNNTTVTEDDQGKQTISGALAISDDEIKKLGYKNAQEYLDAVKSQIALWKSSTAGKDNSIAEIFEQGAKAADTTVEALEVYAKSLQKVNKNLSDKEAAKAAVATFKFAKYSKELSEVLENNKDKLNKWAKSNKAAAEFGTETATAVSEVRKSLKDLYGMDFTEDFIKKNFGKIKKAMKGDIDALNDLDKAAAKEYVASLDYYDKATPELQATINTWTDKLANADLKVGMHFEDEQARDDLNKFFEQTHMSVDQAQKYLNSLGYEGNFTTKKVNLQTTIDTVTTDNDTGKVTRTTSVQNNETEVAVLEGKGQNKTGLTAISDTRQQAKAIKDRGSGKSKGGSKSSKKKEEKSKDELDRYHVINTQIEKVTNALEKLKKQEEKTLGNKLLQNLNNQWNKLNTQVNNYKEKLKIAQGEYNELQQKLSKKGVTFKDDGTVDNYFKILKQKEADLNKVIDWYNGLSAKNQEKEANQKKLEAAKEAYEEFKKEIDRIDELASSEIPNIVQAMHDAIDEEIETNIKAFDLEVKLSLDLSEAQRAWNEFYAKIAHSLQDRNIIENAEVLKQNIATNLYKNEDGTFGGDLVNQAEHVTEIMKEIEKQKQALALKDQYEKGEIDEETYRNLSAQYKNVFGDNEKVAYETLKAQLDSTMEKYNATLEDRNKLYDSYLSLMDEAKDKLDEQTALYEQIDSLLEHSKRLTELMYGDKSYKYLETYYAKQKEKNKQELTSLKKQEEFYRARMDLAKEAMKDAKDARDLEVEGSDAWKDKNNKYLETIETFNKTKEQWDEAVEKTNETLENSLAKAQEELTDTIKTITLALSQNLTGKTGGLTYAEEEWDLINRNADQYLDTINQLQGINNLESKYLDSINKATNPTNQKKIKAAMDAELEALREKKKLTQYDLERAEKKYQITLAQIALEEAQQNKNKMRLRRDSQGNYRYQYVADEDKINKAKEELTNLYTDLYNFDKDRYKSTLSEIESLTREFEEKMEELAQINDPQERLEREALLQKEYQELFIAIQDETETAKKNVTESAFQDLIQLEEITKEEFLSMTQEQIDKIMNGLIPAWTSANQHIADTIKPMVDIKETIEGIEKAWGNAETAMNDYWEAAGRLKIDEEERKEYIIYDDEDIQRVEDLIANEEELTKLIDFYTNNLDTLKDWIDNTDTLIDGYKEQTNVLKELADAYAEWETKMEDAWEAYNSYSQNPTMVTDVADGVVNETPEGNGEAYNPITEATGGDTSTTTSSTTSNKTITDKIPRSTKLSKSEKKKLQQFLKDMGWYTDKIDGAWGKNSKAALKKFQKKVGTSQDGSWGPKTYDAAKAKGYDTGGYTGTWGNDGRLAFLHQKELVLNAQDTENILNTVAIMRNLMASMNQDILSRLAGVSAGTVTNLSGGNAGLEQNVHIDANFPNATNSNEIEEALRNLVNVASQRITK